MSGYCGVSTNSSAQFATPLSRLTRILFSSVTVDSICASSRNWIDPTCSGGPCILKNALAFCPMQRSKIGMILVARRTNQKFCQPPGVALATAETLSRIEVRLLDGVMARSPEALRFSEESVATWPQWVQTLVSIAYALENPWLNGSVWKPVRDVSLIGRMVSGQMVEDDARAWERCPWDSIGLFGQSVTEHALHEVDGIHDVSGMNDCTQPCVFDFSNPGRVFGYVNNFGPSLWISAEHRNGLRHFKTSSMRWFCGSMRRSSERTCRLHSDMLDCRQFVTKTSPAACWRLFRGSCASLKRKAVTEATPLWNSVRFELFLFRDLMVYLESRWRRQWNSMVMSSDASMTGWSLTGALWPREVVSSV